MPPEELTEDIDIPSKQPSKRRKEGRLPIPFKNIGRLVYYSIFGRTGNNYSQLGRELEKPCQQERNNGELPEEVPNQAHKIFYRKKPLIAKC